MTEYVNELHKANELQSQHNFLLAVICVALVTALVLWGFMELVERRERKDSGDE